MFEPPPLELLRGYCSRRPQTNGTVPRITVGTDYALSTLSTIFTKSLAGNIAFMFTNVLSPLHWNFSEDTIPEVL